MFITSRNFSQLRELISLPTRQRNNPEVILVACRKHPETIRRESKWSCGMRPARAVALDQPKDWKSAGTRGRGRSKHWVKVKNQQHPAMSRMMEAFG
jgi:hypothetical protein